MAQELSQAELLDFLCQAGGRVTNAALLGHFKRFLRDPGASPGQLQRRRELFKGFVNSVATVQQEGAPGAAKYVVLRKRYRELVGEEPKPPAAHAQAPDESQATPPPLEVQRSRAQQQWQQGRAGWERGAPGAQGEGCRRRSREERPRNQEEQQQQRSASLTCRGWAQELRACPPPGPGRCLPGDLRGGGGGGGGPAAQLPPSPASFGCPGRLPERRAQSDPKQQQPQQRWPFPGGVPLFPRREAPLPSRRPALPVRDLGAPPRDSHPQQRVREWVERAHAETHHSRLSPDPLPPPPEEGPWRPARPSSPPSPAGRSPSPPLDAQGGGQPLAVGLWPDRVSVFRSIRSQLFLQDLEDFLEQESPASEDGSSASGGSDRENGALPPLPSGQNGYSSDPVEAALARAKGSPCKPQANGLLPATPPQGSPPQEGTTVPRRIGLLGQEARGSSSSDELLDKSARRQSKQLPTFRKVARLPPPPHLDAPLSPRPVPRQAHPAGVPEVGGLGLDAEGSTEHRSSLVPLEPREHAWLVKVATGSWLEAHALLLEDPHLATRKDFISGYTVLHWLAKHGNAKVLQDVVTGAQEAGVALDVNAKSGCGYTPLHLAAMHGHQPVMKLLVQKLQCQIQVRDSSGKRPWQYLGSTTSGEVWQLLGAPRGKTIFPAHPIARINSSASSAAKNGKSPQLGRKISRKASLAAYLKPQHIKWKMANKYPALQEREEYSD
ncbi:ankyrin repeat domain-containing protein SOWAHB [Hemicordylus capensis]|uniref:ankyrin repeat domain-containing protein SOWAHB n=1 Tax=Hemicordylus capensis TaxID=884348 RepID=UPI0023034346|nr:ankyrin repeat domain-containing protein SOWAHB [Hemicordylus capensis]